MCDMDQRRARMVAGLWKALMRGDPPFPLPSDLVDYALLAIVTDTSLLDAINYLKGTGGSPRLAGVHLMLRAASTWLMEGREGRSLLVVGREP